MQHDYNAKAVDATTIATTSAGFINIHANWGGTLHIEEVVVEQTLASDAEFNVQVDGSNIFSSTQSVGSGGIPETLSPDQNLTTGSNIVDLAVDVTASSGTANSELFVDLTVDDGTGRAQ